MYKNKKVLAFIPARKGSKRIKNKNIMLINNRPLFQYSIDVAKKSKYIDGIIVSTDSEEVLEIAHSQGCIKNKLRPNILANDYSRIIDSILYEIEENALDCYSAVVLLQPTSPYRDVDMLDSAIEKYFEKETSLITVIRAKEQPLFMRRIVNDKLEKILNLPSDVRSQDFEDIYKIIGNIYINNIKQLNHETVLNDNEIPFIIDEKYAIDIDTYKDLEEARKVMM